LARVRVRQHVNPLSYKYRTPIAPPDWTTIYANPHIGCGRGKFLLAMAQLQPEINFLGVEIRQPLVEEANQHRDFLKLTNLHYLFCNINISLLPLLESLPAGVLQWVTVQFPDPWFKNRHLKRRVVQAELVTALGKYLKVGGIVFLQSDVEEIAQEMRDRFLANPCFQQVHQTTWLAENPFPVATEREIATQSRQEPVYRVLLSNLSSG
jgi:tRNA (guanine-N7-)-methyltransferase